MQIANLRAGIRTLGGTVNNVLNLRSGDLQMSPMKLSDAIHNALEFVKPIAHQAGVKIDVTSDARTTAIGDAERECHPTALVPQSHFKLHSAQIPRWRHNLSFVWGWSRIGCQGPTQVWIASSLMLLITDVGFELIKSTGYLNRVLVEMGKHRDWVSRYVTASCEFMVVEFP